MTLLRALNSTIGKKFVMAITGLLLCGFLVVHLAGNLLMLVPNPKGVEGRGFAYNTYAHSLHSQEWFVKSAEVGLAILFFAHLYLAIRTTIDNRGARRRGYVEKETKQSGGIPVRPSSWMFWSGVVVLGFLLLHLSDFAMELRDTSVFPPGLRVSSEVYDLPDGEPREPFEKALNLLANPITAAVYVVGCVFLMFHLLHGFRSALQTLGFSHSGWNRVLDCLSVVFSLAIGFGFMMFPVLGYFGFL